LHETTGDTGTYLIERPLFEGKTMTRTAWPLAVALATVFWAAPAAAADKAHQQLMAEIRMLQQNQQQLQQLVGGLTDTLKTIAAKIDDQSNTTRKTFADEKLLIDGVAEGVRVLREKSDDTNVRLSTVTQELEAVRQAVSTMPSTGASAAPGQDSQAASESTPPANGGAAPPSPPAAAGGGGPLISPQKMFDNAYSDYTAGHYDIAIIGFTQFISSFPRSDKADDAQLNIGNSQYGAGQYQQAAEAFQKVIANYPQGDSIPVAYYKLGMTFEALKQTDAARKAFEEVIQKYPTAYEAILAKQRLDGLKGK
jgi:tol-pal system protein YbgF